MPSPPYGKDFDFGTQRYVTRVTTDARPLTATTVKSVADLHGSENTGIREYHNVHVGCSRFRCDHCARR